LRGNLSKGVGFLTAILIASHAMVLAQNPPPAPRRPAGRIIGVYDERTGEAIANAEVRDMVSGNSARTTETGTLSLFFVDTSGTLIRISKVGYTPLNLFVANSPDLPPLTLTLDPIAQTLPTVVTRRPATVWKSPTLRGFEERRATGMGYFVPDSVLRRENDRTLANVIRAHVPSIDVWEVMDPKQLKRSWVVMSRRTAPACPVDVYLDGLPQGLNFSPGAILSTGSRGGGASRGANPGRSGNVVDVNQFQVSELAGVEYHNIGDVPAEYNRTGGGCGVLLLWTRER
jgi:hypothetical protein